MRFISLTCYVCSLLATSHIYFSLTSPVAAGAFLMPPGRGEIITTTFFSGTSRAFDANKNVIPVRSYQKFEIGTYIDYGVTDWLTFVATPSVDHIHTGDPHTAVGIGDSALGARTALYQKPGIAISIQGLIRPPLTLQTDPATKTITHSSSWGGELRLLFGYSTQIFGYDTFTNLELGYRWNDKVTPDEWRSDLTLGIHVMPKLALLLQDFIAISDGRSTVNPSYFWNKGALSGVYALSPVWSVQAGGFATLAGRNAGCEIGPFAGLWYRF